MKIKNSRSEIEKIELIHDKPRISRFTIHDSRFTFLLFTFYFLIASPAMAQKQYNYDTAWKKVADAQNKGLPKTALGEVQKIYSAAKAGKDKGQQIKALVFQAMLSQNITEDSQIKTIQSFEAEMKTAAEPARSILASIAADAYWSYLQQNRYKFYSRTATVNFNKDSVDTWAITDFNKKIADLYATSVANRSILQKIKLDAFEPIIIKGNARKLRPTLYDLLAHKALDYYKTEEYDVVKPAYAFTLNDASVLGDASIFIRYKSTTNDSTNLQLKAVQLFQSLIQFHENDVAASPLQGAGASAFIDVDIERIGWVYQKAVMPEKKELYKKALENIFTKYANNEEAMQAGNLLAAWWQEKAGNYKAGGTEEDRLGYVKAIEVAKSVVSKFPKNQWANNCQNIINNITKKNIQLTVEKVNEPNKPFRTLVKYSNASEVNLAIVAQTTALKNNSDENGEGYNEDRFWKAVTSLPKLKSWPQALPTTTDYREHSVEIAINPLAVGEFYLISSGDAKFSLDKNPLSAAMFYNSNISFVQNGKEVFVLNRSTGQPLANASIQVWASRYDYNVRKNIKNKLEKIITDKNGYAKTQEHSNEDRNLSFEINWQADHLFLTDNIYDYQRNNYDDKGQLSKEQYEKGEQRFFFFTDRSIYRPGQLVYFKAIGITKDFDTRKIKIIQSGQSFNVVLKDMNNQKVDTILLKLNEFGSMNGKFKLPVNLLNGQFTLAVGDGWNNRQYFSVEEYKRPKFLVDFDTVKGSYHVNDDVKIIGNAKAYAGNNVDGATVKYRVKRNVRFLYPWMWWRRPMPTGEEMEITNGETVTKADGTFEIVFKAIPDLSLAKETDPVFDYSVEADVTDINGETRSSTILVPVGYKALELRVTIPQNGILPNDSLKNIFVSSKNLSGQFEPVKATIKIYQLVPPDRLLRKRYWEAPDTVAMDEKTFIQKFPNDSYRDEQDYHGWAKEKEVLSEDLTTIQSSLFTIHHSPFTQGWYIVEATAKDKFGQDVKAVEWFQLYDEKSKDLPASSYDWTKELITTVEPGEAAKILAGTSANNVFVIQQEVRASDKGIGSKPLSTLSFINLNNEKNTNSFSTTESDRGGFNVNRFFVKDNRVYTSNWNINVPWTNKQLDVSFNTFRDKLQPSAEEKWSVTIKGSKGEKVAAEMVASMYDASLDQFKPHNWNVPNLWPTNNFNSNWNGQTNFIQQAGRVKYWYDEVSFTDTKTYDELLSLNLYRQILYGNYSTVRGRRFGVINQEGSKDEGVVAAPMAMMKVAPSMRVNQVVAGRIQSFDEKRFNEEKDLMDTLKPRGAGKQNNQPEPDFSNVTIRKNFNETAFFFPDLHTDAEGNMSFSFTMPEALTKWKLQTLAHTKELAFGFAEKTTVTQKDLMILPNAPRFLREGDRMEFSAKIVNLTDKEITGQSQLQLINTATNENVDGIFHNIISNQYFTIPAGQSVAVKFPMEVPFNYNSAVSYRIVAKAGEISDGEEAAMPVLTNRMLVTETMPLNLRNTNSKDFKFEKLLNSTKGLPNPSKRGALVPNNLESTIKNHGSQNPPLEGREATLSNEALTVEYTSNPTWYAVQALPYLMEYPYECAEQTFNRFYANALAAKIANSTPKIKAIFEKWKNTDTAALMSNLEKNQELKSALLEETPWVLAAQNESQQKKNIGLLFDMVRLSNEADKTMAKLKDMQSSNGGFVWFKGGPDDRYITQYIVTKIGHLRKLGAWPAKQTAGLQAIVNKALPYLDARIKDDYDYLIQHKVRLADNNLGSMAIQYLYMRSFFPEYSIAPASKAAVDYYTKQAKLYWLKNGKYEQGMIALALNRRGDAVTPKAIIKSLKENSISNEEFGMYWKELNEGGYYWWQAPIETQSLLIEAFAEIDKNQTTIDDLKTWLLKQKQTQNWRTTKATSDACYALLLQGSDWLNVESNVTIKLGNKIISADKTEAGTGYFKQRIDGKDVTPEMGNINVTISTKSLPNPSKGGALEVPNNTSINQKNHGSQNPPLEGREASWGAIYWQYFEDLDKITPAKTPLSLVKKLFVEKNTDKGPVLTPINDGDEIKVGDKVKVRIELRVDRNMEYVHMKDMRAACMEPTNVISQYKYQGGLGYYESTKDASTNFFFSYLNKGVYVFEYPLNVTLSGNFSNGITTIQCMYAPEFTSHSEGVRVNVK